MFSDEDEPRDHGVLPVDCALSAEELRARVAAGVPPDSADEFLARVRLEAAGLPQVTRAAAIDPRAYDARRTPYMPRLAPVAPAPPGMEPSADCRQGFLASFAETRQYVARWLARGSLERAPALPGPRQDGEWHHFCFGAADAGGASGGGSPPALRIMLHLDAVATAALLKRHVVWLKSRQLSSARAAWLFALLARLDEPIEASTAALLRRLLRRCSSLRAQLADPHDPRLPLLNLVIVIIAEHFCQGE
jgi:survival of motor neuron protein-interacting protein 1